MNRPSYQYLSEIYDYNEKLIKNLDDFESDLGFKLIEIRDDPSKGKMFFLHLVKELSQDLKIDSEIWSDIGWLATQLLKKRLGPDYLTIYNSEIIPLENEFFKNKSRFLDQL